MKNSSVEWEIGSHVRNGGLSIMISITRKPRLTGSVRCKPFGLNIRSFCIAMYLDILRKHWKMENLTNYHISLTVHSSTHSLNHSKSIFQGNYLFPKLFRQEFTI